MWSAKSSWGDSSRLGLSKKSCARRKAGTTVLSLKAGSSAMRSLSLRRIKGHVVEAMARLMAAGHRRLQEQERLPMHRQRDLAQPDLLARAAGWRQRLAGRDLSSVVAALREDRGH